MLNINNLLYSYSFSLIKVVNINNFSEFKLWKSYLLFLNYLMKRKFLLNLYVFDKWIFYKEIIFLFKKFNYFNDVMKKFLYVLIEDGVLIYINIIYNFFLDLCLNKFNLLDINILSKNKINDVNKKKIFDLVSHLFKYNNFNFNFLIRDNIVLGFKICVKDLIIDASISNILYKKFIKLNEYKNVI